jgi:hypothetical protein
LREDLSFTYPKLASNSQSSRLSLPNAGIMDVHNVPSFSIWVFDVILVSSSLTEEDSRNPSWLAQRALLHENKS